MPWQFWIDRGGTFTDLVGINPAGECIVRKVLSEQPDQPGDPAVRAIREVLELKAGQPIPIGLIEEVRLGTTVATNALLENAGEAVLLFCNRGFRDLLRIGDQHRPELFALQIRRTPFLARAVIEVPGRLDAKGQEIEPISFDAALEDEVRRHAKAGLKSCAIALLHAYRNPEHELHLQDWLNQLGFNSVVCSHQVCPLPRLVPRGQTTLVEATVSPVLFKYLNQVRKELGPSTRLRMMGSSGALLTPKWLLAKDTILSGPAGGMVGAVAAARASGLAQQPLLGFDMGGTSTDVFHVPAGQQEEDWQRSPETEVAGQRLMAQRLPIHTVAAGGGSIISSEGERLQVGPRSAGADPGPACYRRGGPLTITDANLLLGRLQVNEFPALFGPSANQPPDLSVVQKRFRQLAETIGSTPEDSAEGALAIAIERMADAIRQVSLLRGHDIRGGVLVAFGGASGQHACRLAAQLGLKRVLFHPLAGVLSAHGMGHARQRQLRERSVREPLNEDLLDKLQQLIKLEQTQAEQLLQESGDLASAVDSAPPKRWARIELRYASSEQGLMLSLKPTTCITDIQKAFAVAHQQRFSYIPPHNQPLVVERLEVAVVAPASPSDQGRSRRGDVQLHTPPPRGEHQHAEVHWPDLGWQQVPLHHRDRLIAGSVLEGPALVLEATGCIVLEPGWRASVDQQGALVLDAIAADSVITRQPVALAKQTPDPVLLELFHHRFMAIAEQMGERLRQTSRSVNIRERLDFSCALFDHQGALVANAPHIPVHLGSMGESVADLLAQINAGEHGPLRPGETVLSNDPFHGGTHLPDITAITPVFTTSDKPSYFVACRAHHADVGGLTPGSMPPFSRSIKDEGLLLRNVSFVIDGHHDRKSWEQRLHSGNMPPRNPAELLADLQAQVAANQLGVQELTALVASTGDRQVNRYMAYVQANAAEAVRKVIQTLNNRAFSVELDNGAKLCLKISIDKHQRTAKVDFTGTSAQGSDNFQAPLAVTKAAVLYVFRCLVKETIPLNAGCFEPLELIVPNGCLLNPHPPAAVVAGNVETSQALCNLLFAALGVMAASQGTMNNLSFGDSKHQYYETVGGGSGAGKGFDGADGIQTHMTNSRLTDPEILEQRYPVRLELFALRHGSGGLGRWRGGDGLLRQFRFLAPMTASILSGSRRIAPFGLSGGLPGALGANQLEHFNGKRDPLKGCATINIEAGEALLICTPGGGGYGTPRD